MPNLNLAILMTFSLILLPLILIKVLRSYGNYAKNVLVNNYGYKSQMIFGGIGIVIHELAHLITAVIFMHHIDDFQLLNSYPVKHIDTLGYVSHSWNKRNWYADTGNFFIGFSPIFACSYFLWFLHGYLFGNPSLNLGSAYNLKDALYVAVKYILHPFGSISIGLIIYLILIVMVACTGYGLSSEDVKNTISGIPYWIGFIIIAYLFIIFTNTYILVVPLLWKLIVLLLIFIGQGIVYISISILLIIVCHRLLKSHNL